MNLQEIAHELEKQGNALLAAAGLLMPGSVINSVKVTRKPRVNGKKRHFSPAARAKVSAAQKKRWAKWHREQGAKRRG